MLDVSIKESVKNNWVPVNEILKIVDIEEKDKVHSNFIAFLVKTVLNWD